MELSSGTKVKWKVLFGWIRNAQQNYFFKFAILVSLFLFSETFLLKLTITTFQIKTEYGYAMLMQHFHYIALHCKTFVYKCKCSRPQYWNRPLHYYHHICCTIKYTFWYNIHILWNEFFAAEAQGFRALCTVRNIYLWETLLAYFGCMQIEWK